MEVKEVLQVEEKDKETIYRIVVKKNDFNKKLLVFATLDRDLTKGILGRLTQTELADLNDKLKILFQLP